MKTKIIVPPTVQAMMTGAVYAEITRKTITLTYTDQTKETAPRSCLGCLELGVASWFDIVAAVQRYRDDNCPNKAGAA